MHYVWMVIVGFVVGLVARAILPGTQALGFILTAALGIAGSFLAGLVGAQLGWYTPGAPAGFVASVVGAIVLLFVVGKLKGGSSGG
ncbi:MAG: GlsB/YeaQ/YmgE family stress response membrane protein [Burkholderiaceae bacterium]|nr:GlsB/YeaQ/YmgE family stress response membrane protein [Burkholderiaceae bacterium]